MFPDCLEIVIQGVTASGQPFRPSDWAERLCGVMSAFGEDRYLSYSPYVRPIITGGVRCVAGGRQARGDSIPPRSASCWSSRSDNELKMRPGRTRKRPEDIPAEAVISGDTSLPPG